MDYRAIFVTQKILTCVYPLLMPLLKIRRALKRAFRHPGRDAGAIKQSYRTRIDKGLNNFSMIRAVTNANFTDQVALEFGTGSHGVDLFLFYLLGFKSIYTVDVELMLNETIFNGIEILEERLPTIASLFDMKEDDLRGRIATLKTAKSVFDLLRLMNVTFCRFDDLSKTSLPRNGITLFYSESNLQRIPLGQIERLFQIAGEALHKKCIAFHRIDCRDINVQHKEWFYDPDLWRLEYLKYSDWFWNLITTRRFGSQNRLRENDFLDYLRKIDLNLVYIESYVYEGDIEKVRRFRPDRRFRHLGAEEIAVSHSRVVCRRSHDQEPRKKRFVVPGRGLRYPPPKWNPDLGLLEGGGVDD